MTRESTVAYGRGELDLGAWSFPLDTVAPADAPPPAAALDDPRAVARRAADVLLPRVGAGRLAVAVPDRTRPFPRACFLRPLLAALADEGVPGHRVDLLVARGLHGGGAPADLEGLPAEVHLHDPRAADLAELGQIEGVPVRLHRRWADASARLSLGTAGFHYLAGFGGGRKTIAPGLAGEETIIGIHMGALGEGGRRHPAVGCGRLAGNPVHERAAAAARRAPPDAAVEYLATPRGVRFLVGDAEEVHLQGAAWVRRARSLTVPAARKLVVASVGGHPRDRDLIQAHKALEHVRAAVVPGGTVVLAAACEDGPGHEDLVAFGTLGSSRAIAGALTGRYTVYGQTAWSLREKTETLDVVLVSGLDPALVRSLGMRAASSPEAAAAAVTERVPAHEAGWLFPRAGERLVTL